MLIIRQIDWREVGWPLSCNAFAIARFLVESVAQLANKLIDRPIYQGVADVVSGNN